MKKEWWKILAGVVAALVVSAIFMLLFSYSTSPLYPEYYGYDSAIFQTVGKYWSMGILPYTGMFDHKGPLIFFIDAIGYAINDAWGILLIQTILFAVLLVVVYQATRVYLDAGASALCVGAALFYLASSTTFDEGNMTEEYSLLFLATAVLAILRWCRKQEEGCVDHPCSYSVVYGVAFGGNFLLRVTSAISVCCIVLVVAVWLLYHRRWHNLLLNGLAFVGGFVLPVFPFVIYFAANGILRDFWYGTLTYNFLYARNVEGIGRGIAVYLIFLAKNTILYWSPLLILLILSVGDAVYHKTTVLPWIAAACCMGNLALFALSRNYSHYYMIIAPLFPVLFILIHRMCRRNKCVTAVRWQKLYFFRVVFFVWCIGFLINSGLKVFRTGKDWKERYFTMPKYYNEVAEFVAGMIPKEEKEQVLCCFDLSPQWYLSTDIRPCFRRFVMQDAWAKTDEACREELLAFFEETPPEWVMMGENTDSVLEELITSRYEPVTEEYRFCIGKAEYYSAYRVYRLTGD